MNAHGCDRVSRFSYEKWDRNKAETLPPYHAAMKHAALPIVFLCAALPAAAQPIYACPRYDGSTSYQSTPCVGMPSGQQPIVNAPGTHIKRAGEEARATIDAAAINSIRSSGARPECQQRLIAILRSETPPAGSEEACAPRADASPATDAVDAGAR